MDVTPISDDEFELQNKYPKGSCPKLHRIVSQGNYLKWEVNTGKQLRAPPPKASERSTFSAHARKRMIERFNQLAWRRCAPVKFVTLTYGDEQDPTIPNFLADHRRQFIRILENKTGKQVRGFWRVEWVIRQSGLRWHDPMPHYHLLLLNCPFIHHAIVKQTWAEARKGYPSRTEIEACETVRKAGYYVSKYVGKASSPSLVIAAFLKTHPQGNHWGIARRAECPWAARKQVILPDSQVTDAARQHAAENRPAINEYGNESFTLFGQRAREIGQFIFESRLDDLSE
jgi:hypothetical protein